MIKILSKILKKYYQSYGFNSVILRNTLKLFIIFLLITMLPTTIAYIISVNSVKNDVENFNKEEAQKFEIVAENVFRDTEYLSSEILNNSQVLLYMSMNEDNVLSQEFTDDIVKLLNAYMVSRTEIDSIYLYNSRQGNICSVDGIEIVKNFPDTGWIAEFETDFAKNYKLYSRRMDNKFVNAFTFIKKVQYGYGGVIVNIDAQKVRKKISNLLADGSETYIIKGNRVLYMDTKSNENIAITGDWEEIKNNFAGRGFIYRSIKSKFYDMDFAVAIPKNQYSDRMTSIYIVFMAAVISIVAIALLISLVLGMNNMGYVTGFIEILDHKHRPEILKEDEIKYVSDRIIAIIDDNEMLQKDIEKRITEYDNLQKKALNAQITPHFINNSLGAILNCNLKESGLNSKTAEMLIKLSKMLRYSYVGGEMFARVEEEINYIKLYVDFLQYRYNNFECEFITDESIRDEKILKMIMQPFVENAVFYGIANGGDLLRIELLDSGGDIAVSVYDNGAGIAPDRLDEILKNLDTDELKDKHIGIKNVYRRLKLIYGDEFMFEIKSEEGRYTQVNIRIKKI